VPAGGQARAAADGNVVVLPARAGAAPDGNRRDHSPASDHLATLIELLELAVDGALAAVNGGPAARPASPSGGLSARSADRSSRSAGPPSPPAGPSSVSADRLRPPTGPAGPSAERTFPSAGPSSPSAGPSSPPVGGWREWLASAIELAARELDGHEADQFGFDPEFNSRVLIPVARFFYQQWFQVRLQGTANVPGTGAALVVANHSGTLPFDAIMLQAGLHDEHPAHRNLRLLGADLVYEIPVLGAVASRAGHTRACPANAHTLLRSGELVGVFPEGFKGIGKPFADRYQLQRFGRGGFAVTAIRAGVPIVPCAIVGAEEIYPMVGNAKPLAQMLGLPYFPITPLFPWLGPLGAVPLPSRWIIECCPPVPTDGYPPGSENDPAVIADLSGRVRGTIQRKLDDLLVERGPAFG
jgi:1-acyl-sn-glycerol-3-phosphate acyltransferase